MHSGRIGLNVELRDVMQGVDEDLANLNQLCFRQSFGPRPLVIVPADGGHGRQRRQLAKDFSVADVAAVDNVVTPAQE